MTTALLLSGFAILSSSFMGSLHCATMCGPVASLMAQKKSAFSYHLGRGVSYVLVGALGGYMGSFFLASDYYYIRVASGVIFALILLYVGVQVFRGKKSALSLKVPWLHSFYRPQTPGILLGLISILLPCGWLYSYVLAAAATQSWLNGAILMALFWLGGLPALSSVSLIVNKSVQIAPENKQRIAGLILMGASFYTLVNFYYSHTNHCM